LTHVDLAILQATIENCRRRSYNDRVWRNIVSHNGIITNYAALTNSHSRQNANPFSDAAIIFNHNSLPDGLLQLICRKKVG
jgi:hypothetical protein